MGDVFPKRRWKRPSIRRKSAALFVIHRWYMGLSTMAATHSLDFVSNSRSCFRMYVRSCVSWFRLTSRANCRLERFESETTETGAGEDPLLVEPEDGGSSSSFCL